MSTYEIWEHGEPLWQPLYFARHEAWSYGVFRAVANSPRAGVLRRRVRETRGMRAITEIMRPVIVDQDPLGNEVTQRVCLTQRRFVPRSPGTPTNDDVTVVVRQTMVVTEAVEGHALPVESFVRPDLHTVLSSAMEPEVVVSLARPLDVLRPRMPEELIEQAQFIGYLELLQAKLNLDVPAIR